MQVVYWHGGAKGLQHGDYILPPSETGTENTLLKYNLALSARNQRDDRVYFTTDRNSAKAYATLYPNGALYVVIPEGEIEDDPDANWPGFSFMAPSAKVVKVYDRRVAMKPERALRYLMRGE